MPEEIKVIEMRRLASPNPERLGKFDALVVYERPTGDRGVVMVPSEDVSEEAVSEAIRADLSERGEWSGRKLQV